ncbi:hypothetical protein [Rufibacter latericius]|uniref:Translocation/assembly module TamB n=1 Tax=Rufibacter latericius TaxID=2487040 RepID=A0A3M9MCV0_9BACT|nr:hypothetical protein [Rufibacter latericius]RNI23391.1 hypothetical protein EFB08_17750 [Rufibacter latericius]
MKHFYLLLIFLLSGLASHAQSYKISADDPAQFALDIRALMAGTKNAAAVQTGTSFEQAWSSGRLSSTQQRKVMDLAQQMLKKKLKSRPHFENFLGTVGASVNLHQYTGANLDQLLNVIEQTLQKQDLKVYEKFLVNTQKFLADKTLYKGPTNSLQAQGGAFAFEYREGTITPATDSGWGTEEPAAPATPAPVAKATTPASATKTAAPAPKPAPKKVAKPVEEDPWAAWDTPKKVTKPKAAKAASSSKKTVTKSAIAKKETPEPVEAEPVPVLVQEYVSAPLPVLAGPVVVVQKADLLFTSAYDSVTIKEATGAVSLANGMYAGTGGKLVWNQLGGDATAEFKNLSFEVAKPAFKAEDVTLTYPAVLENTIHGNLEYRLTRAKANGDNGFPKFISHTNNAKIKRFGSDIKYLGGLSLAGSTVMSAALDGSPSTIWVSESGEQKFRATSRNYTINDSIITAPEAGIALFQGKDSITHPGVKFKYNKEGKRLVLINPEGLYKLTPYYHSYHQIELTTDMAAWNIKEPSIDFSILTAKNEVPAQVNSKEYFTESRFQQIKTISNFHPLYTTVGYGAKIGSKTFYLAQMAEDTKIKKEVLHHALTTLSQGNFLDYDAATGFVRLREKAYHYVDASRNKKDYDYIHLNALSPAGKNATLNLASGDLILRGVESFAFHRDSSVIATPDSQMVRIQKNRNILFNGKVKSTDFSFRGKEFLFDYDGFFIDLAKIDSTVLTTKTKGKDGKEKETPFTLVNRGGKGQAKLYLNRPDNKSGKKKSGGYPALDAISGMTVYFNKPEILGGVYDTSVYFNIPPFKIDSMASTKNNVIGFKGTFNSGGIFPPFETKLAIQPDGALGFSYPVPKAGFAVYGGKGRFTDTLTMDTKGLRGKGVLSYQTATMHSPAFVFFLDSAITEVGKKGSFKEGTVAQGSYPSGTFKAFKMNWHPYQDTLQVHTVGRELMSIFNDRFTYKGMLGFTPSSLFGNGVVENKEVAMKSPLFVFKKGLIHGNKAGMEVASADKKIPALTTYDIFLDFHMDAGYAEYGAETKGKATTEFPFAQYKSSLAAGKWDFKSRKLTLSSGNTDGAESYFYSMKSGDDSLAFKAKSATYDFSNYTLVASGVPYIPVGDSYLIPDSNRVQFLKDAELKTFQKASLAMDSVQKFHQMVKGELHIDNRFGLTGNALYTFANAGGEAYKIKMDKFTWQKPEGGKKDEPKAPNFFLAEGTVKEKDTLFIMPKVRYHGNVGVVSNKKILNFDGFAKMLFSGNESSDWFPYKRDGVNPEDVRLEIKNPALADGTPLKTGIHVNTTSGKIYNTFVSKKQFEDDIDVFEVQGLLSFNKEEKMYKLGDEGRAYGNSYSGNMLQYNDVTKEAKYDGQFNLIRPVKGFKLTTVGTGTGRTDSSRYELDTFMAFDFDAPSKAIESMGAKVAKDVAGLPEGVELNNATLPFKLAAFIGDKGVADFTAATSKGYVPFSKISPKLIHTLVLNQVNLKWSPKNKAWYSVGPISIAGIDKTDVNAKITGHIEIKAGPAGDAVGMYLEVNPYVWYYFNFYEGGLGMTSSDPQFNGEVASKSKGRTVAGGDYTFYPLEDLDRMEFVNYFRKTYLGKEALKAAPQPVYNTFDTAMEEDTDKKSKKKKKGEEVDTGAIPAGFEAPAQAEEAKGKKKKKEAEGDAVPAGFETPVAKPEASKEKDKKKKKEEAVDIVPSGFETPVTEQEDASGKKKKDKKKKAGETQPDIPPVGN